MPIEFDEAKHPRGQLDNAGQFKGKPVPTPPKATPRRRQPASMHTDPRIEGSHQMAVRVAASRLADADEKRRLHVPKGKTRAEVGLEFAALDDDVSTAHAALDEALEQERLADQDNATLVP